MLGYNTFIIGRFVCGISLILPVFASPVKSLESVNGRTKEMEDKLTSIVNEANQRSFIPIYGDMISLEKVTEENKMFQGNKEESDLLMRKIEEFLNNHKFQIRFPSDGSSADYFGRALGQRTFAFKLKNLVNSPSEARTKLKRIVLPILLALKLKAIIVLPIMITLIGLIGIKGLGAGLLALLLSAAVALKALLTPSSYSPRISFIKPHDFHHDYWHHSQELVNQPYRAWTPEVSVDPEYSPYQNIS